MTSSIVQLAASAGVIVLAGVLLVRAADAIAERTGFGKLLIGSVFLAGATSLPELLVDLSAIRANMPDLAVGDLMGSSLFNLLILAVADLFHRGSGKIFSRAAAAHTLSAAVSLNVTAIAGLAILLTPKFPDASFGGLGAGPLAIAVTYILGLRLVFVDQNLTVESGRPSKGEETWTLSRAVSVYLGAALAILLAAPYVAHAAGEIAEITGLGKTFVGTTLLAACTSLPEVVSTVAAVRMGAFGLAIGNIFGSNAFNMILLVPLDFLYKGSLLAAVSPVHALTCFATIFATSVALMGQLYGAEKRRRFLDPDAFAIIMIVIGALLLLYLVGPAH